MRKFGLFLILSVLSIGIHAQELTEQEALAKDRTIKKGADLIEKNHESADDYDSNAHVMRGCGEVDGRPNCNRDCKHCMRRHCPYRQE